MAAPANFTNTSEKVEQLLKAAKAVAGGKDPVEAGFDRQYLATYGSIARRYRDDRELGLTRYPYESVPGVSPYTGGFFTHPEWPIRKGLEKHRSLRPMAEYEAHYVNACGYWLAFAETAFGIRGEELGKPGNVGAAEAERLDVWAAVATRFGLRVMGLRTEFYRMCARDPQHARLVMPALENKTVIPATDDVDETLQKFDSHLTSQLMKAAANLAADSAVKRSGGGGADQ